MIEMCYNIHTIKFEGAIEMKRQFCQSCGMPLEGQGQDLRGSEVGLEKSEKYCAYCYGNGAFLQPHITFEEMVVKGRQGIQSAPGNKIAKKLIAWMYPMQLKGLERWKK